MAQLRGFAALEQSVQLSPLGHSECCDSGVALVLPNGDLTSYADLRARVDQLRTELPVTDQGRQLVHIPLHADLDSIAAYLAVLESGHVALVTLDPLVAPTTEQILARYPPDLSVLAAHDGFVDNHPETAAPGHLLHPDLALLLSTSGSTGSPKLVRLSHQNLLANAAAIASSLGLTEHDRGITALPLHYCYGLSVLHAHLHVGASLVLSNNSVLDDVFWDTVDREHVTNLAVVPHTLELINSTGALRRPHPALRLITQAGGRLPPDAVQETARLGVELGWDFAVMYGQTEATARIAVGNSDVALTMPDSVGRVIPGSTARIDTTVPEGDLRSGVGELVVRGPGVMMGYAQHSDDLACGAMLAELRTGDLARIDDAGLIRIVGRRSSFVKVMGLRVDLTWVEFLLERAGLKACVFGDDTELYVAVDPDGYGPGDSSATLGGPACVERARRCAAEASGVGLAAIDAANMTLPRLPNGKVDRALCETQVRAQAHDASLRTPVAAGGSARQVVRAIEHSLGRTDVDVDRSFVQLGGDSLNHVRASIELSQILGDLPPDWHHRPLRDLLAADLPAPRSSRFSRWRALETNVVLRALAVIVICGSHAELFAIRGGAHVLVAIAGFNAARFGFADTAGRQHWRSIARITIGLGIPTAMLALVGIAVSNRYSWFNVVLINWIFGDVTAGRNIEFWFVEALIACLVSMAVLLSIPWVSRRWSRDPWQVAIALAVLALAPRFVILPMDKDLWGIMPTVFWLFAAGAALAVSATRQRTAITIAVVAIGGAGFFPEEPYRDLVIVSAIAVLGLVRAIRVPNWTVPTISVLASASLYIYLTQFVVISWTPTDLGGTLVALAAGVLAWRLIQPGVQRVQALVLVNTSSAATAPAPVTAPSPGGLLRLDERSPQKRRFNRMRSGRPSGS